MCVACCHIYAYVQPSCSQHYDKNADVICQLNQFYDITDKKNTRLFRFQIVYRWRHREKRHAACKDDVFIPLNYWWINHHAVKAYVGRRCCLMPWPLLLRMHWIRHCHSTLSPYFTLNYLTLLSPYITWNYVATLCRHTLHEIMSPYLSPYMKLCHHTLSPYFTWNYVTILCRHTWNYVTILCRHILHEIVTILCRHILHEIRSPHSVALLYMKLCHHTLSPYFTWNYVTILCRHTLHKITSQYSVAILFIQ